MKNFKETPFAESGGPRPPNDDDGGLGSLGRSHPGCRAVWGPREVTREGRDVHCWDEPETSFSRGQKGRSLFTSFLLLFPRKRENGIKTYPLRTRLERMSLQSRRAKVRPRPRREEAGFTYPVSLPEPAWPHQGED